MGLPDGLKNSCKYVTLSAYIWQPIHLLVELEHRAYWVIKHYNMKMDEASEHRKLQLQDLEEIRTMPTRIREFIRIKQKPSTIKRFPGKISRLDNKFYFIILV